MTQRYDPATPDTLGHFADDAWTAVLASGLIAAALAVAVLPSAAARAAALAVYCGAGAVILVCARRAGVSRRFGWANRITCLRAALGAVIAGGLVNFDGALDLWLIGALAAAALALDGLDGAVARRFGQATAFGAHFDRETDAALILILSLWVWGAGQTGPWIVAAGLMRYALLLAARIWPALAAPLPESRTRSAVGAALGAALLICLLPVTPSAVAALVGGAALCALTWSFGKDLMWLQRKRLAV